MINKLKNKKTSFLCNKLSNFAASFCVYYIIQYNKKGKNKITYNIIK